MRTFKLMREPAEQGDPITIAFANAIQKPRAPTMFTLNVEPITSLLTFWNMKQSGELSNDEMPAVWLVLMRQLDVATALRAILENCFAGPTRYPPVLHLADLLHRYRNNMGDEPRVPFIVKLRVGLCEALANAAAVKSETDAHVLDPQDCWTLLSACETALVVGEEERKRRWAMENR